MTYGCCAGTGRRKKKVLIKDSKSEVVGRQCLLHDMPGETETLFLTDSVGHDIGAPFFVVQCWLAVYCLFLSNYLFLLQL